MLVQRQSTRAVVVLAIAVFHLEDPKTWTKSDCPLSTTWQQLNADHCLGKGAKGKV